jgi:hypothetical protein
MSRYAREYAVKPNRTGCEIYRRGTRQICQRPVVEVITGDCRRRDNELD